ncbi:MAG: DUF3656 domain-containing protein [Actinobacteria bacterium]|nr:DUF3656 domain-containing protein [Actinomycetota bacterium]
MNIPTRDLPELLAPAGGPDALRAAVHSGADAVYLGLDSLNARGGAENFSLETLAEATRFAHLHTKRVYLTLNVALFEIELQHALQMTADAWSAGVDAVIVQDLGLARLIHSQLPEVRMHASTQVGTHNSRTVEALAEMGFARVTLARELSLSRITGIVDSTAIEVEVFAHGALCVCYSGQCLMSSVIGGRSANRGYCAQPCRLPYEIIDAKGRSVAKEGPHLLSPKDLHTIHLLPELIATGVKSLKIEGRMKSPEYVALVTGVYRAALDRAWSDPEGYAASEAEEAILAEAFSRGFTSAYLTGERTAEMMSRARPNNRGVPIGRVVSTGTGTARIKLEVGLDRGDIVEYWTKSGRHAQKVSPLKLDGRDVVAAPSAAVVEIAAHRSVSTGDRVFRVANASLNEAARRTFAKDAAPRLAIDVAVKVVVGEELQIEVSRAGHSAQATGALVERARTKPITAEEVGEHVGRLGGTPFRIGALDIQLSADAGLGYSALHRLRKEAIEALERSILEPWLAREPKHPDVPALARNARRRDLPEIVVRCTSLAVAKACLGAGAHRAILPIDALASEDVLGPAIVPELPRIALDGELEGYVTMARGFGRACVGDLGGLEALSGSDVFLEADWSLNVTNPFTVEALRDLGASFVWLSPELSGRQLAALTQRASIPVGMAFYGRQELMVTEPCVLTALGACSGRCATCTRRAREHTLRDRKGFVFPMFVDERGRTHILNSVPLDLAKATGEIIDMGIDAIRLDFTTETVQAAQQITAHTKALMASAISSRTKTPEAPRPRAAQDSTSGLFYRGVK